MAARSGDGTAYELSGPESAPVVVLIHGLGLNRQLWQWHEPAPREAMPSRRQGRCSFGQIFRQAPSIAVARERGKMAPGWKIKGHRESVT